MADHFAAKDCLVCIGSSSLVDRLNSPREGTDSGLHLRVFSLVETVWHNRGMQSL